ncbi:hypothetical protein TNCV_3117451 [Trichonephila clavipes]|uniref:Uncharacterized protein n=1 Tax=Trichonephila clavipes TaxID=2585209 RepID=A0A8X6W954_TRICX|nr:hypothetical protein TNCV_3117451 [Trichonephila clavipes]
MYAAQASKKASETSRLIDQSQEQELLLITLSGRLSSPTASGWYSNVRCSWTLQLMCLTVMSSYLKHYICKGFFR